MTLADSAAFIVGTGRCGSTMVSRVLRSHPDVLSLSEFFSALYPFDFDPSGSMTRDELVAAITRPRAESSLLLRHHAEPQELLYPVDGPGRHGRAHGVPPVSITALPFLSDRADELLDRLVSQIPDGRATTPAAFTWLFEWLTATCHKSQWVERSGSSLLYVDRLQQMFPHARFVHLYRSGPACAASMASHPAFRLTYFKHLAAIRSAGSGANGAWSFDRVWSDAAELEAALAAVFDGPVSRHLLLDSTVPVEWFGLLWSLMVCRGMRSLASMAPSKVLHVKYESVVREPAQGLERIGSFLGITTDATWLAQQAASIESRAPRPEFGSTEKRQRLDRACALGQEALASISSPA